MVMRNLVTLPDDMDTLVNSYDTIGDLLNVVNSLVISSSPVHSDLKIIEFSATLNSFDLSSSGVVSIQFHGALDPSRARLELRRTILSKHGTYSAMDYVSQDEFLVLSASGMSLTAPLEHVIPAIVVDDMDTFTDTAELVSHLNKMVITDEFVVGSSNNIIRYTATYVSKDTLTTTDVTFDDVTGRDDRESSIREIKRSFLKATSFFDEDARFYFSSSEELL